MRSVFTTLAEHDIHLLAQQMLQVVAEGTLKVGLQRLDGHELALRRVGHKEVVHILVSFDLLGGSSAVHVGNARLLLAREWESVELGGLIECVHYRVLKSHHVRVVGSVVSIAVLVRDELQLVCHSRILLVRSMLTCK